MARAETVLGPGDVIRISVFQSPDLSVESRISEAGQVNFPLIGAVTVGGLTIPAAEKRIETSLREGGFVLRPQVTIQIVRILSSQVSVLGQVGRPGRYPIDIASSKISEIIAAAGGVLPAAQTSLPWSARATASRSSSTSTCRPSSSPDATSSTCRWRTATSSTSTGRPPSTSTARCSGRASCAWNAA
jgi:protein involved in polysaccharide export with SLBB domain